MAKRVYLISKEAKQHKAELHCHTNCSDGVYSPEELKKVYLAHGFDVVAITDHDIFLTHNDLSDEGFIALNGFELNHWATQPDEEGSYVDRIKQVHINFIAKDKNNDFMPFFNPEYVSKDTSRKLIWKVNHNGIFAGRFNKPDCINNEIRVGNELGFLVSYNHPDWSCSEPKDYLPLDGLFAMEVLHNPVWGFACNGLSAFKEMIFAGKKIKCIATNDFHELGDGTFDLLQNATYICTNDFTYEGIISALDKGDFYASAGPIIKEMYIEDNKLVIECSEIEKACVIGYSCDNKRYVAKKGEPFITRLEIDLKDCHNEMFQLFIIDKENRYACTNPIFNYRKLLEE